MSLDHDHQPARPGRRLPGRSRHLRRAARPRPRRPAAARAAGAPAASPSTPAVWDDPASTGPSYDLVVLRSTVGLRAAPRRVRGLGARRAPAGQPGRRGRAGTPTSATSRAGRRRRAGRADRPGSSRATTLARRRRRGECVVKPAVSAGSQDTGRYDLADPEHRDLAAAHVRRLVGAGRAGHGPAVPARGRHRGRDRAALPGRPGRARFSHAIRKGPMLTGPDLRRRRALQGRGDHRRASRRRPSWRSPSAPWPPCPAAPDRLLYARVDLIPGPTASRCWSSWS